MAIDKDFLAMLEGFGDDEVEKTRESIIKAPFGYPGGKSRSYKKIINILPRTGRYVEVFGGTGIVLMNRLDEEFEVYNDRYSGLIDFYNCVKDDKLCQDVLNLLEVMPQSRELFLQCRDAEGISDIATRAAMWYYSIELSFGCQGRNFGRGLKLTRNKMANNFKWFPLINKRLRNVLIENLDWKRCMKDFDHQNTVFYLDPPYMDTTTSGNLYQERGMSVADHKDLCNQIFETKGYVALSGYENEIYSQYPWDDIQTWDVFISMTGLAKDENNYLKDKDLQRGSRGEWLYIKYAD